MGSGKRRTSSSTNLNSFPFFFSERKIVDVLKSISRQIAGKGTMTLRGRFFLVG